MMQLSDLFASLSYGAFSNLAIGSEGSGEIAAAHQNRLTSIVNQSLLTLYTKFILLEKEVIIRAYDEISTYPLQVIYADTNLTTVPQKFISDMPHAPFTGDVIKILEIYNDLGEEQELNENHESCKLFTPSADVLQISEPRTGDAYFLLYQARPEKLVPGNLFQLVPLPEVLQPALEAHVAYKVLTAMNGQEHTAKAVEHYQRYEAICAELQNDDILSTSRGFKNTKLTERGFK